MTLELFAHPGRRDALGVAFDPRVLSLEAVASRGYPEEDPKQATGRLDLRHTASGVPVRVLATHQRGGDAAQLADLFAFAADGAPAGSVVLVCGDFNEEFAASPVASFATLPRGAAEPVVSRPAHKQDPRLNRSGRGKVDYVFARAVGGAAGGAPKLRLERDDASLRALLASHAPCAETGEWPSDHGMEVLSVSVGEEEPS